MSIKITNTLTGKTVFDSHRETIKEAIKHYQEKNMANLPVAKDFTPKEIDLIKSTIAKGATNDELNLFLYRCKHLELDPLKPGQIYFIKYGSSPGTIVVGIEGFRSKASRTGKHSGTQRGVLKNEKGTCIGAWCEVSRSDWSRPAREEVSLHEYTTGKGNWAKMPETMIKKVAEASALRMAFPDDLGGIYINEEMDQAAPRETQSVRLPIEGTIGSQASSLMDKGGPSRPENPGNFIINFGKDTWSLKGKALKDLDPDDVSGFLTRCEESALKENKPIGNAIRLLKINFDAYMLDMAEVKPLDGQPLFDDLKDEKEIPW